VFAIGATGHTALYTPPPIANQAGSWAAGRTSQNLWIAKDAPACLLPNGNVLCVAGPVPQDGNGSANLATSSNRWNASEPLSRTAQQCRLHLQRRLLLLPTGQVLFSNGYNRCRRLYTPSGKPKPAWKPVITAVSNDLHVAQTYVPARAADQWAFQATATATMLPWRTNYPIGVLRAEARFFIAVPFGHSTMGVRPASRTSTSFKVPCGSGGNLSRVPCRQWHFLRLCPGRGESFH